MENREKIAWALAAVLGLAIIGAGIAFGAVTAYESQKSSRATVSEQALGRTTVPEQTPTATATPQNGFERTAADLIRVVANHDVEGYLSLLYPSPRPSADQVRDMFRNSPVDVAGCDTSGATFRMAELNAGVSLDVIFAHPCGDFGATGSCNVYFKRGDGQWWIYGWACNIAPKTAAAASATVSPTPR
jgi:hypothetical protein